MSRSSVLRRRLLPVPLALAAALSLLAPRVADAQEAFPGRSPVVIVVPFTAGGGVDVVARAVADRMSQDLGVPVLVENRAGGSTVVATSYVARAEPDGHTLLVGTPALAINAALLPDRPPGDPRKVLKPVARLANQPYVLTVAPNLPASTVPELIAWAKARPGELKLGNTGALTAPRMAAELFASLTGVTFVNVPFRGGGPQGTEIVAGRISGAFAQISESLNVIELGARPIAVSGARRTPLLPNVPTVAEFLPGFDVTSWNGVFVPAGTPDAVVARLNKVLNAALADESLRARYGQLGYELIGGTPGELAAHLDGEIRRWEPLRKTVNIAIE